MPKKGDAGIGPGRGSSPVSAAARQTRGPSCAIGAQLAAFASGAVAQEATNRKHVRPS